MNREKVSASRLTVAWSDHAPIRATRRARRIPAYARHALVVLGALASVGCGSTAGAPVAPEVAPIAATESADPPAADPTAATGEHDAEVPAAAPLASAAGSAPAPAPPDTRPRIGSVKYITWIMSGPSRDARKIGYVREGTSVPVRSTEPVPGAACPGGWFGVEPYGFVCADSSTTQLWREPKSPLFAALAVPAQRQDRALPFRYAFSTNAPMYGKIPTEAEQIKAEGPPDKRPRPQKLGAWSSGHEELAAAETGGIEATDPVPEILKDGKRTPVHYGTDVRVVRKWIPNGSMLAYSHAFKAEGRTWLLLPDLTIVPADRVRPFRVSTFHGVPLREGVTLPLAWARHDAVPRYKRTSMEGGSFVLEGTSIPPRSFVKLGTERVEDGKRAFLATSEPGVFVLESDVGVARARDKLPISVNEGEKWIEVHIRAGTLVAYVGLTPVFATLISPGAGGVGPWNGSNEELVKLSATPLGTYRMAWKTRAAAMSPEKGEPTKFWIADVPDTQYFRAPFALHTAYWHEDFGMPKSAGCVNVSPEDGRFLFSWTEPKLPDGWQGVGPSKEGGLGTPIVVLP